MKQRDAYFDNVKGILILLVVIGHLIEPFYLKSKFVESLYTFIYTFHMPAFIFLSGLFFKPDLKKAFYFLKLYLAFQFLRLGLEYFIFHRNLTLYSFLYPAWTLWYLLSMFFWYLIGYFNEKLKISVTIMFAISLLIGFIPFANSIFSFQRTFAYLGFFALGAFINYKNFKNKLFYIYTNHIYIYIMILYCIVIFFCVTKSNIPMELFFNNNPYENLGIFIRIFNFLMASIISIVLFRFTSNKNCLLTKIGQYSLWIYLGHTYFLSGIRILIRYFL